MGNEDVKSHKQLPKQILSHFVDPKIGGVWRLDLGIDRSHVSSAPTATWRIHPAAIKTLGTQKGYYSAQMEQYLNSAIEAPLGNLWNRMQAFASGKVASIDIRKIDEETVRNYFSALIARSSYMIDSIMSGIAPWTDEPPQDLRGTIVRDVLEGDHGVNAEIKSTSVAFVINRSARNFVVPQNGYYCFSMDSKNCYFAPISPNFGFLLVPPDVLPIMEDGQVCHLQKMQDEDDIDYLNKQALVFEFAFNKGFVASATKDELLTLNRCLDENKENLDAELQLLLKRLKG